ncbi:hypothetical protein Tco_0529206 [Tanacetum coccineum]
MHDKLLILVADYFHPVASLTLDSARSCVMQSAFLTQRTVSSIPIVFSWSNSIRHGGFLSPIMMLAVITVAVAMVVLVVVDAIIGVVVIVSGVLLSSNFCL